MSNQKPPRYPSSPSRSSPRAASGGFAILSGSTNDNSPLSSTPTSSPSSSAPPSPSASPASPPQSQPTEPLFIMAEFSHDGSYEANYLDSPSFREFIFYQWTDNEAVLEAVISMLRRAGNNFHRHFGRLTLKFSSTDNLLTESAVNSLTRSFEELNYQFKHIIVKGKLTLSNDHLDFFRAIVFSGVPPIRWAMSMHDMVITFNSAPTFVITSNSQEMMSSREVMRTSTGHESRTEESPTSLASAGSPAHTHSSRSIGILSRELEELPYGDTSYLARMSDPVPYSRRFGRMLPLSPRDDRNHRRPTTPATATASSVTTATASYSSPASGSQYTARFSAPSSPIIRMTRLPALPDRTTVEHSVGSLTPPRRLIRRIVDRQQTPFPDYSSGESNPPRNITPE